MPFSQSAYHVCFMYMEGYNQFWKGCKTSWNIGRRSGSRKGSWSLQKNVISILSLIVGRDFYYKTYNFHAELLLRAFINFHNNFSRIFLPIYSYLKKLSRRTQFLLWQYFSTHTHTHTLVLAHPLSRKKLIITLIGQ